MAIQLSFTDEACTIQCEDIILREYRMEDLDALQALTWQPEIYEWLPGWNVSREQRKHWLEQYEIKENRQFLKAAAVGGDVGMLRLRLVIVSKRTGECIGWCCTGIKAELAPPNREIMYAISKDHRGKGYTTQAVQGMVQLLFRHTNVEVIRAIALEHNVPSNRVVQKCGFQAGNGIVIQDEKYNVFRLSKNDWENM